MFNKLIIFVLLVSLISSTFTEVATEKGTGISDQQLTNILNIFTNGKKIYGASLNDLVIYIKAELQKAYLQVWVVEVVTGTNLTIGVSGGKFVRDQWVTSKMDNGNTFYWVSVPASHNSLLKRQTNNLFQKSMIKSSKKLQARGAGISSSQEVAILNIVGNAERSKNNDPQACAVVIEQKLEDAYSQNWIVEIYGSDTGVKSGRAAIQYKNDQWLFYPYAGVYGWQYFIWVPGY